METPDENENLEAIIDNGPEPKPQKPLAETPYEISIPALSLYFHLRQFIPVFAFVALLALRVLAAGNLTLAVAIFFVLYVAFYLLSTRIADRYAKSVVYAFEKNVISAETTYCGFFSQKTIPIDKVSRITLRQTPLMRFCKVYALDLDISGGVQNRVRLYGLAEAARVRQALISARSVAVNARETKA